MINRQRGIGILVLIAIVLAITLIIIYGERREYNSVTNYTEEVDEQQRADSLFFFDPNTATYEQFTALGLDKHTAVSILKYRARGKVFGIAEEFALCYGITDSIYQHLKPYIRIGEQFRLKPKQRAYSNDFQRDTLSTIRQQRWEQKRARLTPHPFEKFRIDTVSIEYLQRIGFSYRNAEGVIDYRDRGAEGIRNMAELRDCWAVSPEMADSLEQYIIFPDPKPYGGKVEINSADSATLVSVRGIGPKTASAIVTYRKLLGGYVSIEQLSELKCVTSENFALFSKQICCDSCVFSKIDINFAPASVLEQHPYMTRKAINKIIQLRKSKGGWKSFEEIVKENIFTTEQAKSLAPYLHFGDIPLDFYQ